MAYRYDVAALGSAIVDVLAPVDDASARRIARSVTGPLGAPVQATAGVLLGTGIVEMARASGIQLLREGRRDPRRSPARCSP